MDIMAIGNILELVMVLDHRCYKSGSFSHKERIEMGTARSMYRQLQKIIACHYSISVDGTPIHSLLVFRRSLVEFAAAVTDSPESTAEDVEEKTTSFFEANYPELLSRFHDLVKKGFKYLYWTGPKLSIARRTDSHRVFYQARRNTPATRQRRPLQDFADTPLHPLVENQRRSEEEDKILMIDDMAEHVSSAAKITNGDQSPNEVDSLAQHSSVNDIATHKVDQVTRSSADDKDHFSVDVDMKDEGGERDNTMQHNPGISGSSVQVPISINHPEGSSSENDHNAAIDSPSNFLPVHIADTLNNDGKTAMQLDSGEEMVDKSNESSVKNLHLRPRSTRISKAGTAAVQSRGKSICAYHMRKNDSEIVTTCIPYTMEKLFN